VAVQMVSGLRRGTAGEAGVVAAGEVGFLGRVYVMGDFTSPTPETLKRLRAIVNEAFGRSGAKVA
jgi:hypothetical protein